MQYIALMRSIFIYVKNSCISLFSFLILKIIPKKNIIEIINLLKNKKVLVLGTGPSLNKLNQDIINSYEVIFFLNNAISINKIFDFNKNIKFFFK